MFGYYENRTALLYYAWIPVSAEQHAGSNHNLHRRPGLKLEPGLFRDGRTAIALYSESRRGLEALRRELRVDFRIQYISVKRGAVAFRPLAQGNLVSRRTYGPQVKRFYVRGLPKLERRKFEIERIPYQPGYDRRASPRVMRGDGRALYPPEIWKLQNRDRRRVRNLLALAPNGDSVRAVMELVSAVASASALPVNELLRKKLPVEIVRRHYQENAARVKAREDDAARAATTEIQTERSEGATQVVDTVYPEVSPKLLSDADLARAGPTGKPLWHERELRDAATRRAARPIAPNSSASEWKAWAEKMANLVRNRSK
jgi:hypothetical protein